MKNYCKFHPKKEALSLCHLCGNYFCENCLDEGIEYYYCKRTACQEALHNEIANHKEVEQSKDTGIPKIIINEEVVIFCDKCLSETTSEPYQKNILFRRNI